MAGPDLPFLLLGAFRALLDDLHARLAAEGHPDARPLHGFGLQAVGPEGATPTQVAARLGVSKQAATKTIAALVAAGYAQQRPDPADGRGRLVTRTARGEDLLHRSARILAELAAPLDLGPVEAELRKLTAGRPPRIDVGAWLR